MFRWMGVGALTFAVAVGMLGGPVVASESSGRPVGWGYDAFGQMSNAPAGLDDVVAVSAGVMHSVALRADGTVAVWGSNDNDALR